MTDLLGDPIAEPVTNVKGYAAEPGTGPDGMTCNLCAHYRRFSTHSKSFSKCAAVEAIWTNGEGTDIKARAPSCSRFVFNDSLPPKPTAAGRKAFTAFSAAAERAQR